MCWKDSEVVKKAQAEVNTWPQWKREAMGKRLTMKNKPHIVSMEDFKNQSFTQLLAADSLTKKKLEFSLEVDGTGKGNTYYVVSSPDIVTRIFGLLENAVDYYNNL